MDKRKGKTFSERLKPEDFNTRYFSSGGYNEYKKDVASWVGTAARRIRGLLRNVEHPEVLDVGCAHGYLIAALQGKYRIKVQGLEYSAYAVRTAKSSVKGRIRQGSVLERSLFPHGHFDLVSCLDMFGYLSISETQRAANNLAYWTKEYILFSTLYRHSPQASQKINPDALRITTLSQKEYKTVFRKAGVRFVKKIDFGNGGEVFIFKKHGEKIKRSENIN